MTNDIKVTKCTPQPRVAAKYPFRKLLEPKDSFVFKCPHDKRQTVSQAMRNSARLQMPGVKFTIRYEWDDHGNFVGVRATRLEQ